MSEPVEAFVRHTVLLQERHFNLRGLCSGVPFVGVKNSRTVGIRDA